MWWILTSDIIAIKNTGPHKNMEMAMGYDEGICVCKCLIGVFQIVILRILKKELDYLDLALFRM